MLIMLLSPVDTPEWIRVRAEWNSVLAPTRRGNDVRLDSTLTEGHAPHGRQWRCEILSQQLALPQSEPCTVVNTRGGVTPVDATEASKVGGCRDY